MPITFSRILRGGLRRLQLAAEIIAVVRDKGRQGALPAWRQFAEMLWLKLRRRQTFRFYLMARMWRREMPWRDKLDHFNYADFSRVVNTLNPLALRQRYRQKHCQKQRMLQHGVPTPEWFGFFHPECGVMPDGRPLTSAEHLQALLRAIPPQQLVFKREIGSGGEGFLSYRLRHEDGRALLEHPLTASPIDIDTLFDQLQSSRAGYLIERYLVQHPSLAQLNPDSANTLRIWATTEGDRPRVVGAFLRVGRRGVMVDNTAAGGLICTIDDATGALLELSTGDLRRNRLAAHPDSGVAVGGITVPFYAEAKQLACRALACFPGMGLAGLDIAVTEDGPAVIEINLDSPAQIGTACFDVPGRWLFPTFFPDASQAQGLPLAARGKT